MPQKDPVLAPGKHRFIFDKSVLKGDSGCIDLNEWFPIEPNRVDIEELVPFGKGSMMVVATVYPK